MAYEMLTGHTPFADRGVREIMQAHLVETPEPLTRFRPTTPSALATLVMRCLEKDPAHRPQDAAAILAVLDDPAVVSGAVSSASVRSLPRSARAFPQVDGASPPARVGRLSACRRSRAPAGGPPR
jgi:serine/threonine-protein kinase